MLSTCPPIPNEVKDLFNWNPIHWNIIELIIDDNVKIKDLYIKGDSTEGYIDGCINDLLRSGWCSEIKPAGIKFSDRGNDVIQMSKFSKVALENMLKCMDMNSYK